jgi:hypothetical protein
LLSRACWWQQCRHWPPDGINYVRWGGRAANSDVLVDPLLGLLRL